MNCNKETSLIRSSLGIETDLHNQLHCLSESISLQSESPKAENRRQETSLMSYAKLCFVHFNYRNLLSCFILSKHRCSVRRAHDAITKSFSRLHLAMHMWIGGCTFKLFLIQFSTAHFLFHCANKMWKIILAK